MSNVISEVIMGTQQIEDWCSLHRTVEMHYVVDGYIIEFLEDDGQRSVHKVHGPSLLEAIREVDRNPPPRL